MEQNSSERASHSLRARLGLGDEGLGAEAEIDRGIVARILAYLFGMGGLLLLVTLLLPDSPQRDTLALAVVGVTAIVIAIGLITGDDALPARVLRAAPFLGTVLIGFVVYFADPTDSAAYAMFMAWVLVAAALFLEPRLILIHGSLAVAVYTAALLLQNPTPDGVGVRIALMTGTVGATAIVMHGIGRHVRGVMQRLEAAAHTDPLTGIANRRALDDAFARELARAGRNHLPLTVVILDIDGFKRFNDERGHQAGDRALQRLGTVLTEQTRGIDQVARIGGEEFAFLVPDCDTRGGVALAERLRRAVEVEFGGDGGLTASCGVASHPGHGRTASELIAAADGALYEAKRRGRNQVVAAAEDPPKLVSVSGDG